MDTIAHLGVNIDPTEAVKGAAVATKAAQSMETAFGKVVQSWQNGQKLLDNTFKAIGQGVLNMANAVLARTGVVGSAFGAMVRTVATLGGTLQNLISRAAGTFGMLGSAARAAGSAVGSGLAGAANSVRGVLSSITGSVGGIVNAFAQVGLAIQGFKSVTSPITNFVSGAIDSASKMEGFQNRWAFLLGSFDKAKAKMAELQDFANVTPFDLPGVTEAALAVNRLTDATFKGKDALMKIGDAAAIAQQPIEEVASRLVRLSGNLQRGAGGGDELRALTEWGIIAPAAAAKIGEMSTDAGKFKEAIALVSKELDKTKGAMGLMAETWNGKVSTLSDKWNTFLTTLGTPIIEGLKPLLDDLTGLMDNIIKQAQALAPQIKEFALLVPAAFRTMQEEGGLKLAFTAAVDTLKILLQRLWDTTKAVLGSIFDVIGFKFTLVMRAIASPEFWKGVGEALAEGVGKALAVLKGDKLAENVRSANHDAMLTITNHIPGTNNIPNYAEQSQEKFDSFMTGLNKVMEAIKARIDDNYQKVTWDQGPLAADQLRKEDSATLKSINQQIKQANEMRNSSAPAYAKDAPLPGGAGSLFDVTGEGGGPTVKGFAEEWAKTAKDGTDAMQQFATKVLGYVGILKKEETEKKEEGNIFLKDAASLREAQAADDARRGPGATKKENASAAKADAHLDTEARQYLDRDPTEKYQREIAELAKLRDAHKITETQYQQQVAKSTEEHSIAMKKRKEDAEKAAEAEMNALQKLLHGWGNLKKNVEEATAHMAQAMADSISGALTDWVTGAKSASQAFADMAKSMVSSIISIISKLWVQYALSKLLGMAGGATAGAGTFLGSAFKSLTSSSVLHDGGIVGNGFGGTTRMVSGSAFSSAQRYHEGGQAGLKSGEVPAVLERGEMVVPARETASARKRALTGGGEQPAGGGNNVTVLNFIDKAQFLAAAAENPDAIINVLSMRREGLRNLVQKS